MEVRLLYCHINKSVTRNLELYSQNTGVPEATTLFPEASDPA